MRKQITAILVFGSLFIFQKTDALANQSVDYFNSIPQLIRRSQQIVIYAPEITRADIPEAIRLSMNERGSKAIIFTSLDSLMKSNSMMLRLQLMGNSVYEINQVSEPFVILDGIVYKGSGINRTGFISQASAQYSVQLRLWAQKVVKSQKPLATPEVLKKWSAKNLKINLN